MEKFEEFHKCRLCGKQFLVNEEVASWIHCPDCKPVPKLKPLDRALQKADEILHSMRGDESQNKKD